MILNGECGAFNPMLLNCLTDIADSLKELDKAGVRYDFQSEVTDILDEILLKNNLPHSMLMQQKSGSENNE